MTPSQTQALQEVKDEVAKEKTYLGSHNKNCKNWDDFLNDRIYEESLVEINKAIQEVAELYHTRLLAEAGKSLLVLPENPTLEDLLKASELMREQASALLAAKQAELDRLSGWKREAMAVYGPLLDYGQNEMGLKPGESIVTKAIERLKEYSNLKSQLQEAKAEVERLKEVIENRNSHIDKLTQ